METTEAPSIKTHTRGQKMRVAWEAAWAELQDGEYHAGADLARSSAEKGDIQPSSMVTLLYRMAGDGVLERYSKDVEVEVTRGPSTFPAKRKRVYFRIKP